MLINFRNIELLFVLHRSQSITAAPASCTHDPALNWSPHLWDTARVLQSARELLTQHPSTLTSVLPAAHSLKTRNTSLLASVPLNLARYLVHRLPEFFLNYREKLHMTSDSYMKHIETLYVTQRPS